MFFAVRIRTANSFVCLWQVKRRMPEQCENLSAITLCPLWPLVFVMRKFVARLTIKKYIVDTENVPQVSCSCLCLCLPFASRCEPNNFSSSTVMFVVGCTVATKYHVRHIIMAYISYMYLHCVWAILLYILSQFK